MKNSSDTIGNRTRDLPTCSAVPQPTVPPRAPHYAVIINNYIIVTKISALFCDTLALCSSVRVNKTQLP